MPPDVGVYVPPDVGVYVPHVICMLYVGTVEVFQFMYMKVHSGIIECMCQHM